MESPRWDGHGCAAVDDGPAVYLNGVSIEWSQHSAALPNL